MKNLLFQIYRTHVRLGEEPGVALKKHMVEEIMRARKGGKSCNPAGRQLGCAAVIALCLLLFSCSEDAPQPKFGCASFKEQDTWVKQCMPLQEFLDAVKDGKQGHWAEVSDCSVCK